MALLLCVVFLSSESCKKDKTALSNSSTEKPLKSSSGQTKSGVDDFALTTNSRNSALESLGYLPFDPSDDDEPGYPVFYQFVNRFSGFNALHVFEENQEAIFLDNGGEPEDFESHFISDPYLQTILNEGLEVKIGAVVYKILDRYRTIIITDGDLGKLDIVRANPEDYTPQENIFTHDALNPRHDEICRLYDDEGSPKPLSCVAIFYAKRVTTNGYEFKSNSQFVSNATYNWDFGDGTTFTGTGSQGAHPARTFPPNGYPYTVTLQISGPGCNSSYTRIIPSPGICFTNLGVIRSMSHGSTYILEARNVIGNNLQYTWDLGNGHIHTTSSPSYTFTYPTNGTYDVVLTVSDGSCTFNTPRMVMGLFKPLYFRLVFIIVNPFLKLANIKTIHLI